jgi:Family of unknown function (DUF6427)
MITSLFRKSTPLNYSIVIIGVLFFFFLYQFKHISSDNSWQNLIEKCIILGTIFASLFVVNFIIKKNGLSKDSAYTVLFYLLFLLFFPSVLDNFNLIISNFCILLALRRLLSLQSLKSPKEKIFDASLWVFIASLFHFWSILFIIIVFISILFHVARDYRNWFLPFIAFFTTATIFVLASLFFNISWIANLLKQIKIDLKLDYFTNNYQNLALSLYATVSLFFIASLLLSMSNRPLILHPTYKKIISAFVIGVLIYIVSPNKSNDLLLFTIAPLAIITTSHIEMAQVKWQQEVVLSFLILGSFFIYFTQL